MKSAIVVLITSFVLSLTGCMEDVSDPLKGVYRGSTKDICASDSLDRFVEFQFINEEKIKLKVGNRTFYKEVEFDPYTIPVNSVTGNEQPFTLEIRRWRVIEDDYRMILIEQNLLDSEDDHLLIEFIDQKAFVVCLEGEPLSSIQLRKVD